MYEAETTPSRRRIFVAAAVGSLAPQILRWYSQGGVSIPGGSLEELLGWLTATGLFIVLAGYIGVYIWRETDIRKAFFIGVGVPSIILSGTSDLANSLSPGEVGGQPNMGQSVGVLEVSVKGNGGGVVPGVKVSVRNPSGRFTAHRLSTPANFHLRPGKYSVVVGASGYETQTREGVDVTVGRKTRLEVLLRKRSFLWGYFKGISRPFQRKK